jgi:hypothetical protein
MEDDRDDESLEYEPEFSFAIVGLILYAAFVGALYALRVRGWWLGIGIVLFFVVWWRYRWRHTGLRQRHRQAVREARVKAIAQRQAREDERKGGSDGV